MNAAQKKSFIRDLCNCVKLETIARVKHMPEEWDGHELRALLAKSFEDLNSPLLRKDNRRRRKAFWNEVIVRNL
jgi:hypothetical protein